MPEHGTIKKEILKELSKNSRISITDIAKRARCSRNAVIDNIKLLEDTFGLKYTLQFGDDPMLPIYNQAVAVKFRVKPKDEVIRKIFKDQRYVSLAAITEGDFDLLVHMVTDSVGEYTKWAFQTFGKLHEYGPMVKPSTIDFVHIGFMPIPDTDLSQSKMTQFGTIDEIDQKLLLLLNGNSTISESAMAKSVGKDTVTVKKRIQRLHRYKIIERYTTILLKSPNEYNFAFFLNYRFGPNIVDSYANARNHYINANSKIQLVNSFQYVATMKGSYSLFGICCFDDEETAISEAILAHKEIFKANDVEISYARIKEVVQGNLPIRYANMEEEYKAVPPGI